MKTKRREPEQTNDELDPLLYGPRGEDGKIAPPSGLDLVDPEIVATGKQMLQEGKSISEVSRALGVHLRFVVVWRESVPCEDFQVRKPKDYPWMSADERSAFLRMLDSSYAYQHGLRGERWTNQTVLELLRKKFPASAEAQLSKYSIQKWLQRQHFRMGKCGWERTTGWEAIQKYNTAIAFTRLCESLNP